MADEKDIKQEEGGPKPAFSIEDIRSAAREAVQDGLQEYETRRSSEQPAAPIEGNPLRDVLRPVLDPELSRINIIAEGAKDAAIFYSSSPEASAHKDYIEKAFQTMVQNGTPMNRDAIYKHWKGENEQTRFKAWREEEIKREKEAEERKQYETIGGGNRPVVGKVVEARDLPIEELEKALEGMTF